MYDKRLVEGYILANIILIPRLENSTGMIYHEFSAIFGNYSYKAVRNKAMFKL